MRKIALEEGAFMNNSGEVADEQNLFFTVSAIIDQSNRIRLEIQNVQDSIETVGYLSLLLIKINLQFLHFLFLP